MDSVVNEICLDSVDMSVVIVSLVKYRDAYIKYSPGNPTIELIDCIINKITSVCFYDIDLINKLGVTL